MDVVGLDGRTWTIRRRWAPKIARRFGERATTHVGGAVARVVFRRPWTVEAVSGDDRLERQVVGWRRAGVAVEDLAREISHGRMS